MSHMTTTVHAIRQFLAESIKNIEADVLFNESAADLEVNAPVALMQVELKAQMGALKAVQKIIFDNCSHKFVDSKVCLHCGWEPPPRKKKKL